MLLAAWALVLVAWLSLQWLILPRLDEWRPKAETLATRALGHPVQIGRLATDVEVRLRLHFCDRESSEHRPTRLWQGYSPAS